MQSDYIENVGNRCLESFVVLTQETSGWNSFSVSMGSGNDYSFLGESIGELNPEMDSVELHL